MAQTDTVLPEPEGLRLKVRPVTGSHERFTVTHVTNDDLLVCYVTLREPPRSSLSPYTTLCRSDRGVGGAVVGLVGGGEAHRQAGGRDVGGRARGGVEGVVACIASCDRDARDRHRLARAGGLTAEGQARDRVA